jgi:hypothetical protein
MDLPPPLIQAIAANAYQRVVELNGPRDKPAASWLDGWRQQVGRFRDESMVPRHKWTDLTLHRHDWVGALSLRDIVQRAVDEHRGSLPEQATAWLELVDNFMRSFTEEVDGWAPVEDRSEGWWWSRLPVDGPVRAGWSANE